MPRVCYIPGCRTNKDYYESGVGLFSFPKDPDVLLKWKQACGKDDSYQVPIGAAICKKHFDPNVYYGLNPVRRGKSRLNVKAVPTLCLKPEEQLVDPLTYKKSLTIKDEQPKIKPIDVSTFCRICTRSCEPGDRMDINEWIFGEEDNEMHKTLINLLSLENIELDPIKSVCMLCYNEVIAFVEFAVSCRNKQLRLSKRLHENASIRRQKLTNVSDDEQASGDEYQAKLSDPESENETEAQRNLRMDRYIQRVLKLINGRRKQIRCTRPWDCLDCREVFPSRAAMDRHRKTCSLVGSENSKRKGPFTCSICSKVCNSITGYRIHLIMMHDKDRRKRKADHDLEVENTSEREDDIPEDLRLHKMKKCVRCPICKDAFFVMRDLKYHLMSHDSSVKKPKPKSSLARSTICNVCGKIFKTSTSLNAHLKFHAKEKDWHCNWCDKRYYQRCDLITHVESVHERRKAKCDKCDVVLSSYRSLLRHSRLHDSNKMQRCTMCPKRFPNKTALRYHMLSHSGVKKYKCAQCPAAYHYNYMLTQHKIRIHGAKIEGVKLYKYNQRPVRKYRDHMAREEGELQQADQEVKEQQLPADKKDDCLTESKSETKTETDTESEPESEEVEPTAATDRIENEVVHEEEVPNIIETYVEIPADVEGNEEEGQKEPEIEDLQSNVTEEAVVIEVVKVAASEESDELASTETSLENMSEEIHSPMEVGSVEEVELEVVDCIGQDFFEVSSFTAPELEGS